MAAPSAEEFERWLDDPVTRYVQRACKTAAEANKEAWIAASWGNGLADPIELATLRARSDAYCALIDTEFDDWRAINGDSDAE